MYLVKGTKRINASLADLDCTKFVQKSLDLGTGDGRFVYKHAKDYPDTFWVGVDPAETQLRVYSAKINRERLQNVALVVADAENLPQEFTGFFNEIYINFPWGTLLKLVVEPTELFLHNLHQVTKPAAKIKMVFGYKFDLEPSEYERLQLPEVNEQYIKDKLIPRYQDAGFTLENFSQLNNKDLVNYETSWSKKLGYGNTPRPVFLVEFKKC